jgi:RND family efflux transporter MFP subunit
MKKQRRIIPALLQTFFCLLVLAGGGFIAVHFINSAPEAKPKKRQPRPHPVEIQKAHYTPYRVIVRAMGTVVPAREVNITARVSGEIIKISPAFVPGGFVKEGEELLVLDSSDYLLQIQEHKSNVAKAENDLFLEMGNQLIAQKEFEFLDEEATENEKLLMLRKPHLANRQAALESARAKLARAELELQRTRLRAPFNGIISSISANLGSVVSKAVPLARLIGTDEYWLKLNVPKDKLKWISIPKNRKQQGSDVTVYTGGEKNSNSSRRAEVLRLAPELEKEGRMAILFVSVTDPLNLNDPDNSSPELLLGSFLSADIKGTLLRRVVPLSRRYLHENNTLHILSDDNTLQIRKVEITFSNREQVFISSGVRENENIITTSLSTPVAGMVLKVSRENYSKQPEAVQ